MHAISSRRRRCVNDDQRWLDHLDKCTRALAPSLHQVGHREDARAGALVNQYWGGRDAKRWQRVDSACWEFFKGSCLKGWRLAGATLKRSSARTSTCARWRPTIYRAAIRGGIAFERLLRTIAGRSLWTTIVGQGLALERPRFRACHLGQGCSWAASLHGASGATGGCDSRTEGNRHPGTFLHAVLERTCTAETLDFSNHHIRPVHRVKCGRGT